MDIVEYVEKTFGIKLFESQKEMLRKNNEFRANEPIIFKPINGRLYLYNVQNILKELTQNGETLNRSIEMPTER